jgi:hypothetical protein
MSTRRCEPEQIVNLLRQVEVEIANGKARPQVAREAGINAQGGQAYGALRETSRGGFSSPPGGRRPPLA